MQDLDKWYLPNYENGVFGDLYLREFNQPNQRAIQEVSSINQLINDSGERISVADIAGGYGRIAEYLKLNPLIERYYLLDINYNFLQTAHNQYTLNCIQSDMRSIPLETDSINLALIMFSSFGYFTDASDDLRVAKEVKRILKNHGRLIIDLPNYDLILRYFNPLSVRDFDGGRLSYARTVNRGLLYEKRTFVDSEGKEQEFGGSAMRIYTKEEITTLLKQAGFMDFLFLDELLNPYEQSKSKRLWVIAS